MGTGNTGLLDGLRRIGGRFRDLVIDGGLPGAPLGFRLRGATPWGPPTSGTWRPGDLVADRFGNLPACTSGGTPGSWAGPVAYLYPSPDVSGATSAAAINAAAAALAVFAPNGGVIRLASTAPWYIECGQISVNRSGLYIDAEGCYINAVGVGDLFRMYDSSNMNGRAVHGGGLLGNPVIDGTNTTGAASALHLGDIFRAKAHLSPQNFTQSGSDGAIFDNQWYWTERLDTDIHATNCYRHVRFTQNPAVPGTPTATGSFMRGDLKIYVNQQNATYDGIVFENGTYPLESFARWWGNFNSAPSGGTLASAAIKVTGITPTGSADSPTSSNLYKMLINWGFECASGTYTPYAVWMDTASGCGGSFLLGTANFSSGGSSNFNGWVGPVGIFGQSDLFPIQTTQATLFEGITAIGSYDSAASLAGSGTISTTASWSPVAPAGAVTGVILQSSVGYDGQLASVFNDSAFSITFAASGTSNVSTGTGETIPAGSLRMYQWSSITNLWYPVGSPAYVNSSGQAQVTAPALLPAGTASAAPLNFTSGTLETTPAAGAVEFDGTAFYATAAASSRQVVPAEQFACLSAGYTGSNVATAQKVFNATANGAITLAASTTYEFEGLYNISTTGATSHSLGILFGGTATLTSIAYQATSTNGTSGAISAASVTFAAVATVTTVTAAVAAATNNTVILKGTVRVNAAGTFIPEFQYSAAPGAAPVVAANSYFRLTAKGSSTVASVGDWS